MDDIARIEVFRHREAAYLKDAGPATIEEAQHSFPSALAVHARASERFPLRITEAALDDAGSVWTRDDRRMDVR